MDGAGAVVDVGSGQVSDNRRGEGLSVCQSHSCLVTLACTGIQMHSAAPGTSHAVIKAPYPPQRRRRHIQGRNGSRRRRPTPQTRARVCHLMMAPSVLHRTQMKLRLRGRSWRICARPPSLGESCTRRAPSDVRSTNEQSAHWVAASHRSGDSAKGPIH